MKCLISLDFLRLYIPTLALHLSVNSVLSVIGVPDAECIATVTGCMGRDNRTLGAGNQLHPTNAAFLTKLCSILVRSGYWVGQVQDLAPISAFSLWSYAWHRQCGPSATICASCGLHEVLSGFPTAWWWDRVIQEPLFMSCLPGERRIYEGCTMLCVKWFASASCPCFCNPGRLRFQP